MSKYENYSEVSKIYDETRVPIGADILIGALARLLQSCPGSRLLDAGCGTGSYAALALPHVGRIDAMDINPSMLDVARKKLADATRDGSVTFHEGSVQNMPFEAACFDAVMFNQVLHHLESGEDGNFEAHRSALVEAHRVLRPGGLLIVNFTTHDQLRDGFWFMHLIPTALLALYNRCIPVKILEAMSHEIGFSFESRFALKDGVLQGTAYFDPNGPLKPEWRKTDSAWALSSAVEINAAEVKLLALQEKDGLDAYMTSHDSKRPQVGQATFFIARKT